MSKKISYGLAVFMLFSMACYSPSGADKEEEGISVPSHKAGSKVSVSAQSEEPRSNSLPSLHPAEEGPSADDLSCSKHEDCILIPAEGGCFGCMGGEHSIAVNKEGAKKLMKERQEKCMAEYKKKGEQKEQAPDPACIFKVSCDNGICKHNPNVSREEIERRQEAMQKAAGAQEGGKGHAASRAPSGSEIEPGLGAGQNWNSSEGAGFGNQNSAPRWGNSSGDKRANAGQGPQGFGNGGGNWGNSGGNWGNSGGNWANSGGNWGNSGGNWANSGGNWGNSGGNWGNSGGNWGNSGGNWGNSGGNWGNSGGNGGNSGGNWGNSQGKWANSQGSLGNSAGNWGNSGGNWGNPKSNWDNSLGKSSNSSGNWGSDKWGNAGFPGAGQRPQGYNTESPYPTSNALSQGFGQNNQSASISGSQGYPGRGFNGANISQGGSNGRGGLHGSDLTPQGNRDRAGLPGADVKSGASNGLSGAGYSSQGYGRGFSGSSGYNQGQGFGGYPSSQSGSQGYNHIGSPTSNFGGQPH